MEERREKVENIKMEEAKETDEISQCSPRQHKVVFEKDAAQDASPKGRMFEKGKKIYIPSSRGCLKDDSTKKISTETLTGLAAYAGSGSGERHGSTATEASKNDILCCYRSLSRKKILAWGGPFRELMAAENYSLFDYFANNVPFGGIKCIFHTGSGWPRTIFYIIFSALTGYFFIGILIKPLVQQYQTRDVTVSFDSEYHSDGFPYPIITVCPKGTGIRCDCQLWQRLACHFKDRKNSGNFQVSTCDLFEFVASPPSVWDKMCNEVWNVSSLNWNDDPCGGVINGADLFDKILQRDHERGKPIITVEEQIVYGGYRFAPPNINFRFLNITNAVGDSINFKYLNYKVFDIFSGRIVSFSRPFQ